MTKEIKKEEITCKDCKYFKENNCTHKSNIGFKVKNRIEKPFFVKTIEELAKTCKNYEKFELSKG